MAHEIFRIAAAISAVVAIVVLIGRFKLHAFLALSLTAIVLGLACGIPYRQVVGSFEKGFGDVAGHVGVIIGLGVILGGLLVSSGGAELLASSLIKIGGERLMPWAMCLASLLIGLPLFFEVSLVLLAPICFAVAKQLQVNPLRAGIPMMAGIIGAHALLPPHPAPTVAVSAFSADAGKTILYGLLIALPALIVAGPLLSSVFFGRFSKILRVADSAESNVVDDKNQRSLPSMSCRPHISSVYMTALLPPGLMLLRSGAQLALRPRSLPAQILDFVGDPVIAMLIAVIFAMLMLGIMLGRNMALLRDLASDNLASAAGVILITGAGGGLKQVLIDTRIGETIVTRALHAEVAPLLLAWVAAALLRVTIGTSTVSTIMVSGLMAPAVVANHSINRELLVLSTGCGSVFGSHVNDPGFWFIKQYFNLTLEETFKSWTVLTVLLSLVGLVAILLLSRFV